jgi:hypothetical protein
MAVVCFLFELCLVGEFHAPLTSYSFTKLPSQGSTKLPWVFFRFSIMVRHRRAARSSPAAVYFPFELCPTGELHSLTTSCFLKKHYKPGEHKAPLAFFSAFYHGLPSPGSSKLHSGGFFFFELCLVGEPHTPPARSCTFLYFNTRGTLCSPNLFFPSSDRGRHHQGAQSSTAVVFFFKFSPAR